jgi:hypothetical protein
MKLIEVTLAGFKRLVPEALIDAYKSFGWTVPGAKTAKPEEPQVSQAEPKTKTTRKKKETA